MNGKPRSLLSQLVPALEASQFCCAHPPPLLLYQSFFSSPCSLRVPPSSSLFSLQAVGNRLHRGMENFLKLEKRCQSPAEPRPPVGCARYDRRTVTIVPRPLSFIKPTFTRTNSLYERREKSAIQLKNKQKKFINYFVSLHFCVAI